MPFLRHSSFLVHHSIFVFGVAGETLRAASVHFGISYFYLYWKDAPLPLFQSGEGAGGWGNKIGQAPISLLLLGQNLLLQYPKFLHFAGNTRQVFCPFRAVMILFLFCPALLLRQAQQLQDGANIFCPFRA